jgi:hypothetical protein
MDFRPHSVLQGMAGALMCLAVVAGAQTTSAPTPPSTTAPGTTPAPAAAAAAPADAAPAPLSTFVLSGPLQWLPPATVDAGPFGKLSVNGIISGFAQFQNNAVSGDNAAQATLSNGQIMIQKADGNFQYYIQAGAYALPTLSVPFVNAQNTSSNLYGPVPVAFVKLLAGKTTSFQIGQLPTLMGAEGVFTYQNFNVERGLLWNQENVITRAVQINQAMGKYLSASFSVGDGYYSNRYNFLTGSLTLTKGPHSLVYDGMGNLGQTVFETAATPIQNNGQMHAIIYTYTKGPWVFQPYFQYANYPTNKKVGVTKGTSATGFAASISYACKDGFALPLRFEYLSSSGSTTDGSTNLLGFGSNSSATTYTATPTFQKGGMFIRSDLAYVHATNYTLGDVFGPKGTNGSQFRAALEFGFIFGNNITK